MDLHHRLEIAGHALLGILDPEKELMPMSGWEVAHDLGRWWDAVLRLEKTVDFAIPAELEAASLRNLQRLTDNPDRLLMNRTDVPWLKETAKINAHNFRESLLAFGGLVRRRDSLWAREAGLQLVRAMDRALGPDGNFDFTKLGSWGQVPLRKDTSHSEGKHNGWFDATGTSGRALEALVWLFESTGESAVLGLAQRIAERQLESSTNRDGTMREEIASPDNPGHDHSYHGTLRGLLLFGLLTGQREYVDVVEATYRNAVRNRIVKESGWAPHDLGMPRFPNAHGDPVADPASTGDSAQLALWLALRAGCDDLLDDVERLVRARLLPAQLTPEDVRRHPEREFPPRQIGAWGIHEPSHGGKTWAVIDVLAAVTHSLCDIYNHICTDTQTGIRVNLHLDYEDARVRVASRRGLRGELSILVKQPADIMVRIPQWVPESSVHLTVNGERLSIRRLGMFACVPQEVLRGRDEVVMSYDLPTRWTEEHMPSGRCYRFKWRGDEITGVDPQDDLVPFYLALEDDAEQCEQGVAGDPDVRRDA